MPQFSAIYLSKLAVPCNTDATTEGGMVESAGGLEATLLRDRELASADSLRLAQLRDEVDVKLRFGLATFNAASLVALLSAAGAAPKFLASIGFQGSIIETSVVAFAIGTVAAGVSTIATQNELTVRAGIAAARVTNFQTKLSAFNGNHDDAYKLCSDKELELHNDSLKRSDLARWSQSLAGGCWVAGALAPLISFFGIA